MATFLPIPWVNHFGKMLEKQKEVEQFNQKRIAVQSKVTEVKSQVQSCVDQIIAIIEAKKQDVFDAVDNQATKSLESLLQKKDEVENQLKRIGPQHMTTNMKSYTF